MKTENMGDSRSRFHRSFPNSFRANLEDIQQHSEACLSAMNILCQSGTQMAEAFTAAFHDTPFAEVSMRMRQVSQDFAARTRNASAHIQEDAVAMVTRLLENGPKDKTDESIQTLAHCFLLMLQTQFQFFQSASELFTPLGRYQEIEDILVGYECEPSLKEACSSWFSASQATSSLRRGDGLCNTDLQLLRGSKLSGGGGTCAQSEKKLAELRQKVDALSLIYKYEFAILPCTEFTLKAGFHLHPQSFALVLKGICTQSEAEELAAHQSNILSHTALGAGAGSQSRGRSFDDLRGALQQDLQDTVLQVEGKPCKQASSLAESFQLKWDAVKGAVKEACKQCGLSVDIDNTTLCVLCHASPSVSHHQSRMAVQILFGRAYLVTVKPAKLEGGYQKYAQISAQEGSITIEVPTLWVIGGLPEWQQLQQTAGVEANLGKAEVVYSARINLPSVLDGRKPDLPTIRVKLCRNEHHAPKQTAPQSGHSRQGQRHMVPQCSSTLLRKSMHKLAMKFTGASEGGDGRIESPLFDGRAQGVKEGTADDQVNIPEDNNNEMSMKDGVIPTSTGWKPGMVNPTVTITSETSPTEEHYHWSKTPTTMAPGFIKKGLVSDAEVQDIVDFLSGVRKPPTHLDPNVKLPQLESITPTSSSSSSSKDSAGGAGGWTGPEHQNPAKFGNYNPSFQDADAGLDSSKSVGQGDASRFGTSTWPNRTPLQTANSPQGFGDPNARVMSAIENNTNDAEFAQYIAANFLGKRTLGYAEDLNLAGNQGQWGYPDRLNRSWPTHDPVIDEHDSLPQSWSIAQDSPGSSSDESSNGENAFSMGLGLTGPNFVASVTRRRHSSGGEDALHGKPHDPGLDTGMKYLDVIQADQTLMRTWPPKFAWQRPTSPSPQNPPPSFQIPPQEQLLVHAPLAPQWSDPVGLRQQQAASLWPPAGGSTPVSPTPSMATLPPPQQTPPPQASSPRSHPKLDRRYAYSQY